MSKQIQDAYIVAAIRTPVGKAPRGMFRNKENVGIAYGMGITAEKVAAQWKVSREDQDAFAVASHQKAAKATASGGFRAEILPYEVETASPDLASGEVVKRRKVADV